MEQVFATADKLSEVIQNMQKYLQCSICLHTVSEPVKTRCGHRFCHECIQTVLQNKNATCPLCNSLLLRRSISKDEHMELYIDRLQKLIKAIQMDTGIDILLQPSRPRSTHESCSSGTTDRQKLDPEASVQPSCPNVSATAWKNHRRSSITTKTRRKQSKRTKTTTDSSRASDITKYLKMCPLSGVEALLPDESTDYQDDSSTRIQNWLETLPRLDDPDRAAPASPIDFYLDDTLKCSVPQNPKKDKPDKLDDAVVDKSGRPVNDNDDSHHRDLLHSRTKDTWTRENKENETHRGESWQDSKGLGARIYSVVVDDQKPSTSGFTRPKDEWKEKHAQDGVRSHEKTTDVHRTSPCNMLPSMKDNWSSVVRFGKEMRPRRKKLKSLNVSIESKGKHRSLDESVMERAVRSRVIKGGGKQNERDTPESIAVGRADERALEERLPNVEGARGREQRLAEEASPRNKGDGSMSEGAQPAKESSFITLDEGEQVHIRDLKGYQMNDIIGVASSAADQLGSEIESVLGNRAPKSATLSLAKRGDLPEAQDRAGTPFTSGRSSAKCSVAEEPNHDRTSPFSGDRNICSTGVEKVDGTIDSPLKYQSPMASPTTSRNRLSLKRRSTDPKSNEAQSVSSVSRLLAVKRDLSRQMDEDAGEMGDEAGDGGLASKRSGKLEENGGGGEGKDVGDSSAGSRGASISHKGLNGKEQSKGQARHLVAFKKLGKVLKPCKTPIRFLYLGTTRRRMLQCRDVSVASFLKPCNPVDSSDLCPHRFCTTENSFGNNTRITVNDTVATEQADTQSNLFTVEKGTEAMTRGKVDAGKGQSVPDQPGPSTNKAPTTKRVDMYKESTPKDITRVINSATSMSQDSDDVLLVSLYEEQASAKRDCPINPSSTDNTASKSTVRLLSPKKDSQLKFLSLDSPTTDNTAATKFPQQTDAAKDTSAKRNSFSDIRGAHSRALILRSQQASGSSTPDSSCTPKRKRKRSSSLEKLSHKMKRRSKNEKGGLMDDDSDSDRSLSFKTTLTRKDTDKNDHPRKIVHAAPSGPTAKDVEVASLSSDTGRSTMQQRTYRRIIPVASSDTDSPDVFCVDSNKNIQNDVPSGQIAASPTSKRKRAESLDSDDDEDLNVIVSSWYKHLNPAESSAKKGKVEQTRASSVLQKKSDASLKPQKSSSSDSDKPPNRMFSVHRGHVPDIPTNSEGSSYQGVQRQTLASRGLFDDDSPDFGATIDRIREFEVAAAVNERDSAGRQRSTRDASLMQDNFDEVIANVDTQALIGEFYGNKQSKRKSGECSLRNDPSKVPELGKSAVSRPRASNMGTSTSLQSEGSNKENKYQNAGTVCDVESDDEVTSTPEYVNVTNRSSRKDKSLDRLKPFESGKGSVSHVSLESKTVLEGGKIIQRGVAGIEGGSRDETCYEYDSLMDVTQHDLLIKQFEEDLFGRPLVCNVLSETEKRARKQQTPQKLETKDVLPSDSKGKDAEHSGEDDDIVENTPDIKTRSIQTMGSTSKESSVWTPVSRMNGKQPARTPPSAAGRSSSSTPLSKRSVHPLYQSTPKAQAVAKSNGGAGTCTGARKPDLALNKIESFDKQTIPVASKGARSAGRERLCFVCSGLVASQIENVKRLAQTVDARYVTQFEQGVSHVIVKVNQEDNGASKTLKYLQGIAHRKWIVGYQWVIDSLTERKLVNEERYEAVDCRTLEAGPRNSRLREKGLFEGFVFLCKGPYVDVSVEQYQELLRATGAIVVDSLEALTAEKRRLKIIVMQADVYNNEIIGWYKKTRALPIVHDWVVECISRYRLLSVYPYLQELSRRDVLTLGYPEFLVEEEPDEDSDSNGDAST